MTLSEVAAMENPTAQYESGVLKTMALRLHLLRQEKPIEQAFPMPIGSRVLAWVKNLTRFLGNQP